MTIKHWLKVRITPYPLATAASPIINARTATSPVVNARNVGAQGFIDMHSASPVPRPCGTDTLSQGQSCIDV